jgi:cytochrome c553
VSATHGATTPNDADMASRLDGGNLTCSACHDQHNNGAGANTGTPYSSYPRGVAQNRTIGGGGGTLTVTSLKRGAAAKGYLIQFVQAGTLSTALFKLSSDGGNSWFGCMTPTSYPPLIATFDFPMDPTTDNGCRPDPTVPLDSSDNIVVSFAATTGFQVGDKFQFYVGLPLTRIPNGEAEMCVDCHRERNQAWQDVQGGVANGVAGGRLASVNLGTTVFSHPVGQGMDANVQHYDRATPIEPDGTAQGTDGNPTNDLVLSPTSKVTCLTCHSPHNADSNSLSTDPR